MNRSDFTLHFKWRVQISALISVTAAAYVKSSFIFDAGNKPGTLLLLAMIAAAFTFIFGILSLPRPQFFFGSGNL